MAEAPGTVIEHYRLLEPIGTGGFATVYRAYDELLDTDVAIKILAENHSLDPDIRERFVTEAQMLRRLSACPAVIDIYGLGETNRGQPYMVLELAQQGDLGRRAAEHHQAGKPLLEADLEPVVITLADSLAAIHDLGLVHRDVKPRNLLIASTGGPPRPTGLLRPHERILLSDLGLAKDLLASSGLTVGSGTEGFSAPEQREPAAQVDTRADIWAATAVMFWLVTQQAPPSDRSQRHQLLNNLDLPPGFESATDRGLTPKTVPERSSVGRRLHPHNTHNPQQVLHAP